MLRLLKKIFAYVFSNREFIPNVDWKEGALYSLLTENGYTIFKTLKIDENGVHIKLYSNLYSEDLITINESDLFIAEFDSSEKIPMGIEHMPFSFSSINTWGSKYIQDSEVSNDELKGYEIWKKDGGGYF